MTKERGSVICPMSGVATLLCALAGAPAQRRGANDAFFDALLAPAALAFAGRFAEGEIGEASGIS
ncbi:MAG TPA: hypothetical protein VEK35_10855 [Roseiarcus sp.]|nr:hypothetical protein [Roseiarcus sp.]